MDYLKLLEESYEAVKGHDRDISTRHQYLSEYIFNFITYDGDMGELFGGKAVEVCEAINTMKTFEYIKENTENYRWYLIMCNMPFFCDKLQWGGSIRGAWWDTGAIEFSSCGLWNGQDQITLFFDNNTWKEFINEVVEFASKG